MRRGLAAALVLAFAMATAGCVSGGTAGGSACADETRSAGSPGSAEPMLVFGAIAYAPTIVYADGAVVVPVREDAAESGGAQGSGRVAAARVPAMAPGYFGPQPGGFRGGSLTDCQLAEVVSRADALFAPDVDFGSPAVTDHGSTRVSYRDFSDSIYAFDRAEPTEWSDLTPAQQRAREDLAALWSLVEDRALLGDELPVDRLHVHVLAPVDRAELVDWPGGVPTPVLTGNACTTFAAADEVTALLDRLGSEAPLLEGQEFRLAIVAAAPGSPDCG